MTEHPGEQFPPDVDPDVEPGFAPDPSEEAPTVPDYDTEPGPQNHAYAEAEVDTEAAFEASLDESAGGERVEEHAHVDPAEVEFGPEFARSPGQEHEHSFLAESAEDPAPREQGHPSGGGDDGPAGRVAGAAGEEHAEVYADLHERLQSALVEADAEHGDRARRSEWPRESSDRGSTPSWYDAVSRGLVSTRAN